MLDGGRGATTTFTQRGIGDVPVTWRQAECELIENEVRQGPLPGRQP